MIYLDTSVLLAHYLEQARAEDARELMNRSEPKVSSWLLLIETSAVLRRTLTTRAPSALAVLLEQFEQDLQGITLFDGFREASQLILRDTRFTHCRALDALHAASAIILQRRSGHPVQVASFDDRLNTLAKQVGLGLA